ncbi:MAG: ABC transporter permease, partial [Gemmatimonadaceae bacterium]
MTDTLIIARREFRERVHSRSFLIGTLLLPVFMAGLIVLPQLIRGGGERKLAVVDESGASLTGRFTEALAALHTDTADATSYTVEPVARPLPRVRDELNRRVRTEELDGYVVFPADVLERNEVQYRARSIANFDVMRDLRQAASRAVQAERLRRAGLDGGEVASIVRPVEISGARITAEGEEGGSALSTFWLAYMVAFLVYFMTAFYGTSVMRSVLEEKTNRIAEVMVSSVRASHLMAGKILGVGAAALLQVLIWGVMIWLVATQSDLITRRFN